MTLYRLFLITTLLTLSGCAAVTITESGNADFRYRPHFEETKHFFLWGLIGEHTVNTQQICGQRQVVQMQSKFTAKDVLFAGVTLGLYLPRTARVWCKRKDDQ